MSEDIKRIPLEDDYLEEVAGGAVQMVCKKGERYVYGTRTPDVRYYFECRSDVVNFVSENYSYYGEAGIFQAMLDAGIITPLN